MKAWRFALLMLLGAAMPAMAEIALRDDYGRVHVLKEPVKRVITLAPYLTEMMYEIGAGDLMVATDDRSDFPMQALALPKIDFSVAFPVARLSELKPDLIVVPRERMREPDVERLSAAGVRVFVTYVRTFDDITRHMEALGRLTGRDSVPATTRLEDRLEKLRSANATKTKVPALLEMWHRPIKVVSGENFMTDSVEVCRVENIFQGETSAYAVATLDEVTLKDPNTIIGIASASTEAEFRANWAKRPGLAAVRAGRLVFVPDDAFTRPSPHIVDALEKFCGQIDDLRAGRPTTRTTQSGAGTLPDSALPSFGSFVPSLANPVPSRTLEGMATPRVAPAPEASKKATDPAPIAPSNPPANPPAPARRSSQFGD